MDDVTSSAVAYDRHRRDELATRRDIPMAIDPALPRSRRAILAAGLGGLAATALHAVGRPDVAAAANGDPVLAGQTVQETAATAIQNTAGGTALQGISDAATVAPTTKVGVHGYANQDANARGVFGNSPLGTGVYGSSVSGFGLRGVSTSNTGLRGDSTTGTAVRALSVSGRAINASTGGTSAPAVSSQVTTSDPGAKAAVQGFVGAGGLPVAATQTGVQGRCDISPDSVGVLGESTVGTGVVGDTGDGYGVVGIGYYGVYGSGAAGIVGDVDGGTGVQGWTGVAIAPDPLPEVGVWAGGETGRTALQVSGIAKFSRAGKASVAVGASSVAVTLVDGVTSSSFGVASPQTNRAGYYVQAVVLTVATGQIRIYLNKAVTTSAISVGWMVVG
jgi:hypothetical protein